MNVIVGATLMAIGNTLCSMAGTLAAFLVWGWLTNRKKGDA